jgi:hypothetical protein
MRVTFLAILVALLSLISTGAASSATANPNLKVRLVAPVICFGDMPCDPPVRMSFLVLSRAGATPLRVRVAGPGTIWLRVHSGLYTIRVASAVSSSASRVAAVRVPSVGIATVRIMLPA